MRDLWPVPDPRVRPELQDGRARPARLARRREAWSGDRTVKTLLPVPDPRVRPELQEGRARPARQASSLSLSEPDLRVRPKNPRVLAVRSPRGAAAAS